jgi:hypothetical protein
MRITLSIATLTFIMFLVYPLFFEMTETVGNLGQYGVSQTLMKEQYQISQEVNCATTPNINCRIDREVYEGLTYRDIFSGRDIIQTQLFSSIHGTVIDNDDIILIKTTGNRLYLQTPMLTTQFDLNDKIYVAAKFTVNDVLLDGLFTIRRDFTQFGTIIPSFSTLTNNFRSTIFNISDNTWNFGRLNIENYTDFPLGTELVLFKHFGYYVLNLTDIFNVHPTHQQLDEWLSFYVQHKDQGIVNDYYHIDSQEWQFLGNKVVEGIDNLTTQTNAVLSLVNIISFDNIRQFTSLFVDSVSEGIDFILDPNLEREPLINEFLNFARRLFLDIFSVGGSE